MIYSLAWILLIDLYQKSNKKSFVCYFSVGNFFAFVPSLFSLSFTSGTWAKKLYISMDQCLTNQSHFVIYFFFVLFLVVFIASVLRLYYIQNASAKKLSCLIFFSSMFVCLCACECKSIKSRREKKKQYKINFAPTLQNTFHFLRPDMTWFRILIAAFMQMKDFTILNNCVNFSPEAFTHLH